MPLTYTGGRSLSIERVLAIISAENARPEDHPIARLKSPRISGLEVSDSTGSSLKNF
jgi:hypothetical protein